MEAAIKKRGGHRARATVLRNEITTMVSGENPSIPNIEMSTLELERQRDKILELDDVIMDDPRCDVTTEITESSTANMELNYAIQAARDFILSSKKLNSNENRRGVRDSKLAPYCKLPQLNLCSFPVRKPKSRGFK